MSETIEGRGGRHMAGALACTTVGVLPGALFGGLAPLIRAELGFSASWIGVGVALFFLSSSLTSIHAGRLVERLGSRPSLWLGVSLSATSLLGIGTLANDRIILAALLAFGGLGNAVIQPAANLALARGVPSARRGLAFGLKQAAIPTATALGGFAVPVVGITLGWRVAFLLAAGLALLSATLPAPTADGPPRTDAPRPRLSPVPTSLWLLAAGIGLGTAAANAMASYLVESSIHSGWAAGQAGIFLGVGSATGIMARLTVGWISDRMMRGWLRLVALMMVTGSLGFASLALLEAPTFLAIGVFLSFVAGWGYNGLFLYAVVRLHPESPAAATGVTQMGAFAGPVVGPPLFGIVAVTWSYELAWISLAVMSALAGLFVQLARRQVERERPAT